MRPYYREVPSVSRRATSAQQQAPRKLFAHALFALLLLLVGGLWNPTASAAVAPTCNLVYVSPTSQSGAGGATLNYSFDVNCNFGSTAGTIAITSDGTGGASVTAPAGGTFTGPSGNYPFSIQLGPNPGFVSIQIDCPGCATTKTLFYGASYPPVYNMSLAKVLTSNSDGDGSGTVTPGDVLTYTTTATNTSNVPVTNLVITDPLITPNTTTCPSVPVNGTCLLIGTYTVTPTDARNGKIVNTSQATANEFCSLGAPTRGAPITFPGFCTVFSASQTTQVFQTPMMSVSKALTRNSDGDHSGNVTVGDTLLYTVTATNTGLGPLINVQVSDPLLSPNSVTCPTVPVKGTCRLTGSYTVTAADLANGSISNTGSATATGIPGTLSSNTVTTNVYGNKSMTVTKALTNNADGDGSGTVTLGDVLTYAVTATNTGNVTLNNVQVEDPLTTPNATSCPTVAPGANCVLSGTYTVTATDVSNGSISNTGRGTSNEFCPDGCSYFNATLRTPVTSKRAMTISKALTSNADGDGSGTVTLGDVLTYTVTATNTGNVTLNNVEVLDSLISPNSIFCGAVTVGATCVLTGTYTVTATDVTNGSISNTGSADDGEGGTINIRTTLRTPVNTNPAMTVNKTLTSNADGDGSGTVTVGDVLTYTVTMTNTGNVALTNVHVNDPLTTPSTITCATVALGGTCVLVGTHAVSASDASNGSISNTGTATAAQLAGQVSSSLNTPVVGPSNNPAMTVVKTLSHNADGDHSGTVTPGDVLTYKVTVTNTGNVPLTNVQVSDPLTSPNATTCANVAVGATCVLTGTYTVTATDASQGSISNTGRGTSNQFCSDGCSYFDSTLRTPVGTINPAMTVVKTLTSNADGDDSGTVTVGDVLTYTVTMTNTGNATLTNVHVSDQLTTPSAIVCPSVAVGDTCVLIGTHTVTAKDAKNGSISNIGTATAQQLTGPVSSSLNTPVVAGGSNPAMTVIKTLSNNADGDASGTVTVGDVLTYTVTMTNTGNVALTSVHISDPLTTPSAHTCMSVPVDATCVLTGTYKVTSTDAKNGSISNTGSATAKQLTGSVSSSLNTPVVGPASNPAMTVVKTLSHNADGDNSGTVTTGDVLTYKVTATNTGNVPLTNVQVSDPLTSPNATTCATVAVGATCVLTGAYTVTANDASAGSINNTGSATANQFDGSFTSSLNTPVVPGAIAYRITIVSGNGQSAPPGQSLPQDFVVLVSLPITAAATQSLHGQASTQAIVGLGGIPVQWQVLGGGGSLSLGGSTTTDPSGHTSNHYTLGGGAGLNQVQVTVPGGASVTFNATSVTGNAILKIVSGDGQSLTTNTPSAPLVVELTNNGLPVPNATIAWTANNATLGSATSITDSNGRASNTASVKNPGTATVTASSSAPAASPVTFGLNGGIAHLSGLTPQQLAIAGALDNACEALAAKSSLTPPEQDLLEQCQALAFSAGNDPDKARNALDELFFNISFLETSAALLISNEQFDNIKARIAALRSGTGHTHFGGLAFSTPSGTLPIGTIGDSLLGYTDAKSEDKQKQEIGTDFDRWGFFAAGTFGKGSADPRQVTPGFGFHTNGLTAGVDYRYNDHLIFGVSAGYAKYSSSVDRGRGGLDTHGWSLSAYSTLFRQDSWYADGVLTWGSNTYDITRRIIYTLTTNTGSTTVDQTASSNASGTTLAGALTFGRDFSKGPWSFGPYFRGTYTRINFDKSQEVLLAGTPGNGIGFEVESRDLKSVASVLGAKINYASSQSWGVMMPHAEVEWEHEFQSSPDSITARFLHDPTATPIMVRGDAIDTDFFRLGLGMSFVFTGGRSGFIYYEKTLGRTGITQDNIAIGLRLEF